MKFLFSVFILGISTTSLCAQKQMGIKFSPGMTLSNLWEEDNIYGHNSTINWGNRGSFGFGCGWVLDIPIAKNHLALSTGLWYSKKNYKMDFETPIATTIYNSDAGSYSQFDILKDPQYLLHYLQLPITVKAFTNPSKGNRFYFQAGVTLDLKIKEQPLDKSANYLYQLSEQSNGGKHVFKSVDIGLYGAAGYEWKLINGYKAFWALSINKGMLKQLNSLKWYPINAGLDYFMNVKFTQIGMEIGYMF